MFASDSKHQTPALLLLIALCSLFYANSLFNGYAVDDYIVIQNQNVLRGIPGIPDIFTSSYIQDKTGNYDYRPIVLVSYALEREFFGENPTVSHLINVVLYMLTVCFIFFFLQKLLKNYHPILPFVITLLYCIHPLHTEVVNNLKSRDELWCFLFGLLCLYYVFRFYETKGVLYILGAFVVGVLAYWSKRTIITFIAVAPMMLYFFTNERLQIRFLNSKNKILTAVAQGFGGILVVYTILSKDLRLIGIVTGIGVIVWLGYKIYIHLQAKKPLPFKAFYQNGIKYLLVGLAIGCLSYEPNMIGLMFILALLYGLYLFTDTKQGILLAMLAGFLISSYLVTDYRIEGGMEKVFTESVSERKVNFFENPLYYETDFKTITATGFSTLLTYAKLLIFPHPLRYYYGYNQIPIVSWSNFGAIFSLLFHLGLFIFALIRLPRKSLLSFGILFYLVTISLYANIVKPAPGIVGERFANIPSLGFSIIVGYLLLKFLKIDVKNPRAILNLHWKMPLVGILSILTILCATKVISRNMDWKDSLTLYAHDIEYLPNSAKAQHLYAQELLKKIYGGKIKGAEVPKIAQTAEQHFKRTLDIYPEYRTAWNNLGYLYLATGKCEKALPQFAKAIELDSLYFEAIYNTGFCHQETKQPDKALHFYRQAIELQPTERLALDACIRSATILSERGQTDEALQITQLCLQHNPENLVLYQQKAQIYYQAGNFSAMLDTWEKALIIDPNNKALLQNVARGYLEIGNQEKSIEYQERLRRLGG